MATRFDLLQARKDKLLAVQAKLEELQNSITDPVSELARRVLAQLNTVAAQIAETDDEIDQILGSATANQPADEARLARIRAATQALHALNVDSARAREIFEKIVSAMEQAGGN